jgi:predicted nucleic acid-binding Zn ribbon protein
VMEFEDQFLLDHLLFTERVCRTCGQKKDLLNDFYRTKNDRTTPSAYSYECKDCTKIRVTSKRKKKLRSEWEYPDW